MRFRIVHDALAPCPYLPGETSRLPLRMPLEPLSPEQFDVLLEAGDRRTGPFLYRTQCPSCSACEPIRIPVARFEPNRTQRKLLNRNEGKIEIEVMHPVVDAEHTALYNLHKTTRGLATRDEPSDEEDYELFLSRSCVPTREFQYRIDGALAAVTIIDFGKRSASGVYHYFDPAHSALGLGNWSKLRELQICRELGIEWYYFGLYVGACSHLAYKATYFPHQRKSGGAWREYADRDSPGVPVEG